MTNWFVYCIMDFCHLPLCFFVRTFILDRKPLLTFFFCRRGVLLDIVFILRVRRYKKGAIIRILSVTSCPPAARISAS